MGPDHLVRSHVLRQMTLEHFVANVTVERLQVRMIAEQMLFERIRPVESLAADVARVIPNVQVTLEVHFEVRRAGKGRRAVRALVLPDAVVGGQVLG